MIPDASLPVGIGRGLKRASEAIRRVLSNRGWAVRQGSPTPSTLPNDSSLVYYAPSNTNQGESGHNFEAFNTVWTIHVIKQETHDDTDEYEFDGLYEMVDDVIEALTGTSAAVTLDGAVNWTKDYAIQWGSGTTSGGDRKLTEAIITFVGESPFWPIRCT